ncbi:MAG: MraY family glycosyltransferase [Thermodesulfobacteriota bacterium]
MTERSGNSKWKGLLYGTAVLLTGALLLPSASITFALHGARWAYILILSAGISFCLTPVCMRVARRFNILDLPDGRKRHDQATPLLGGMAVFMASLASILLNGIYDPGVVAILSASLLLFAVGLMDDISEVPAVIKLLAQIVAVIIVVSHGVVLKVVPTHLGTAGLAFNLVLTFLWIIGITNALNFFDGMNGLAAGLGAIIAFFLSLVAYQTGQPLVGWLAIAVMGGCLGFLPYNFRARGKAAIFLGDAGSTFIGFILACLAVYGVWSDTNPVVALVSPLLIFWVLIFDMIYITVDRIATGKVATVRQWLEYVGRDHLHHRLAIVLGGNRRSVVFIFALNSCLGISAVVIRHAGILEAALLLLQAVLLVLLISVLEKSGRLRKKSTSGHPDPPLTKK